MAALRPGQADLARASDQDLFRQMGRIEVVRSNLAARLQALLQTHAIEQMRPSDDEVHAAAGELQKKYARSATIVAKRVVVSDQERKDLAGEIDYLEDIIRR